MASQQTDNTETWNPWRTVAMESFVDHWQRAPSTEQSSSNVQDAFEQVLAPELEDPARSPLEEDGDGDDDEDWVVVEKPMVEKSHWTRTMTDTEFNRVFQQPLPHNYGRANTQPSAEENYLKTFNVKADQKGVYGNTLSFVSARQVQREGRPKKKATVLTRSSSTAPKKKQKTLGKQESPVVATKDSSQEQDTAAVSKLDAVTYSRGNAHLFFYKVTPEKEREKHDMFDVLAWPEPESDEAPSMENTVTTHTKETPTPSSLDPRNYAYMDPSCTKLISPAGIKSPRSEPIGTVFNQ